MAKQEPEKPCPGCGLLFSEPEWTHDKPVADWPVVDGLKFHGFGCVQKYHEKLAAMSRVLSSEVAK